MKAKKILKQTVCAAIAVMLLCGCNRSQSIENETSNTDMTQNTSTVLVPETSTVTENTVTTAAYDPFREWYLAEVDWKAFPKDNYRVQVDEKHRDWVIQTPKQSTVQIGDVVFTVDFFKEVYHFGEGLQVRLTIMNTGKTDYKYKEEGTQCYIIHDESSDRTGYTVFRREQLVYAQDDVKIKTISPGDSVIYEYLFLIDSSQFYTAGKYTFFCNTIDGKDYIIRIPLEVIAN